VPDSATLQGLTESTNEPSHFPMASDTTAWHRQLNARLQATGSDQAQPTPITHGAAQQTKRKSRESRLTSRQR
jgi:hypothetical protein